MKFIIILAAFCIGAQGFEIPEKLIDDGKMAMAQWISEAIVNRLQKEVANRKGQSLNGPNPQAALLPPIDDPAYWPTLEIPLDFELGYLINSTGHTSYCQPEVTGLSVLTDEFVLGIIGQISVKWNLEIPNVAIKGPYQLDQVASGLLFANEKIDHVIKGEGEFSASVKNVFLNLNATGKALVGPITLLTLSVDLGYSDLTATAENSSVDGKEIYLGQLTSIIDALFKLVWTEENKPVINEAIKCTINHVVNGCTLNDIAEENLDCLDLTLDPTCFGNSNKDFTFGNASDFSTNGIGYCDQFPTAPPLQQQQFQLQQEQFQLQQKQFQLQQEQFQLQQDQVRLLLNNLPQQLQLQNRM